MSFSKAKLHRFNEVQNCTPSPADYNVSQATHVAGAVIPKTDRFSELRSPASSDNSSFISTGTAPTFRTPNPPRKIKTLSSAKSKTKPHDLFQKQEDLEALKEKIVECNNKDLYIQDLIEQVEDMKLQLNELQSRLAVLNEDKSQLEVEVGKLNEEHNTVTTDLVAKHHRIFAEFNDRVIDLNREMEQLKREHVKLKEENNRDLTKLLQDLAMLEQLHETLTASFTTLADKKAEELESKAREVCELEAALQQLKQNHAQHVGDLTKKHQAELEELQFEMLRTVAEVEKERANSNKLVKEVQVEFGEEKAKLCRDFEAAIKQREENYKEASVLAEIQMKEKCSEIEADWQLKLAAKKHESDAILKECQAIAEYTVIQCEVEKNKAIYELAEHKKAMEELQMENSKVSADCSDFRGKCNDLEERLTSLTDEFVKLQEKFAQEESYLQSMEQANKDKHLYEVTISKTHVTIEALKRRLMNSDRDVEQLKAELEATEVSKLEVDGKCNQLMDELQLLSVLYDETEERNDLALKGAIEKANKLEKQLLNKVDTFKEEMSRQINNTEKLDLVTEQLTDAMRHLEEQQKLNSEAQKLISLSQEKMEHLESQNAKYAVEMSHLKAAFDNIQGQPSLRGEKEALVGETSGTLADENKRVTAVIEQMQTSEDDLVRQLQVLKDQCSSYETYKAQALRYEKEAEEAFAMCRKYIDLSGKYDVLMQKFEALEIDNKDLRETVAEQEALIGPFRDTLMEYEMEYKALMDQKRSVEHEAKEMGMKYAQMLGHQNLKQKIKHLADLKKKNYDLAETNKELEAKVRSQARTIEKLKKEQATMTPKKRCQQPNDKENIPSPLRDRN